MEVIAQAPQPTIVCYHSIQKGGLVSLNVPSLGSLGLSVYAKSSSGAVTNPQPYQEFTPNSVDISGKNLQSYNFERSIDNFGGSFSFSVKEDIENSGRLFMDEVEPLDIIVISESGSSNKIDFIGVVTTVSIGGIASTLNKTITISGKSIEWLFLYYNINCDIKCVKFNTSAANDYFKTDLADKNGTTGFSIKSLIVASYNMFDKIVNGKATDVSNFVIGDIIKTWFGDPESFVIASDNSFKYPISSNLFTDGKINVIDYVKKLLPTPIYEIFSKLDNSGKPKIYAREAPYDNPKTEFEINPTLLTDFTLTRTCDEVYTAFMPYIEGSSQSPAFYMNAATAEGISEKTYDSALRNTDKVGVYGYQLLTVSFVGYNSNPATGEQTVDNDSLHELAEKIKKWFSNLDDMYAGDFTVVNIPNEKSAGIGDWVKFAKGMFYIISEKHSWSYGDNPMINYSVTRGGEYTNGQFKRLGKLSDAYREFE